MAGRPSTYTEEIAEKICEIIATSSKSLRTICKPDDMPAVVTILKWLKDYPSFAIQYARAKEEQADHLAEEILDISDDSTNDTIYTDKGEMENREWINRSRLRVDTRKWIASKLKPKKYGDKVDVTSAGEKIQSIQVEVVHAAKNTNE